MDTRRFPVGPVIIAGALLAVLLHAWLARFAHPMADDFSYALRDATYGTWEALRWEHLHWNGRYASNPLMLFGPLRQGLAAIGLYRSMPVLLMVLTMIAAYLLLRVIGPRTLARSTTAFGALLWTALFMHATPALGEAFYWYTGAMTYQLANCICLVHFALVVRLSRGGTSWWLPLAAGLSGFIAIGFNEVMMALLVVFHLVLLVVRWRSGMRPPTWMWVLFVAVGSGAVLMATAPGNAVRAAHFPLQHRLMPSIGMSVLQTARFLLIWASSPVFLGLTGLMILFRSSITAHFPWTNGLVVHRILLSALPIAVVFLCTFPAYWSTGILGQYRTMNMACFFALPLMMASVLAWSAHSLATRLIAWMQAPWIPMALSLLVFAGFFIDRNGERAVVDLVTGRAERSDDQLWARYALLQRCSPSGMTELPLITDPPQSLHVMDIRPEPDFMQNVDYALWFGCGGIRPKGAAH